MNQIHRTAADTDEHVVHVGRCLVYSINGEPASTAGTLTLRDAAAIAGSNVKHVCAAALIPPGKNLRGVLFMNGLTAQCSNGADRFGISYEGLA